MSPGFLSSSVGRRVPAPTSPIHDSRPHSITANSAGVGTAAPFGPRHSKLPPTPGAPDEASRLTEAA